MFLRVAILLFTGLLPTVISYAQPGSIHFQKLKVENGLNDGMVNGMAQDADGYLWLASLGALNRFDGMQVKRYAHRMGDSTSLRNAIPYALASRGRKLWIGYTNGLQEFDTRTATAKDVQSIGQRNIFSITPLPDDRVIVLSGRKLYCFYSSKDSIAPLAQGADPATQRLLALPVYCTSLRGDTLLLGTTDGVVLFNWKMRKAIRLSLPGGSGNIGQVGTDMLGGIWMINLTDSRIWRMQGPAGAVENLDHLLKADNDGRLNEMIGLVANGSRQVWIGTKERGLIAYDVLSRSASYHRHQAERTHSLSADIIRTMYQSPDGTLWLNTMYGIDYFVPGSALFQIIFPFADQAETHLARGVAEDSKGNIWMTSLRGISTLDIQTQRYTVWRNENGKPQQLYNNSVRGIAEDEQGRIWIATAGGINRLTPSSGRMEFLQDADGVPAVFFFGITKDRDGKIWMATRDRDGFYYYDPADQKIHGIGEHSVLKAMIHKGGRYLFHDSKKRYWLGFNGSGLAMYDPATNQLHRWWYDIGKKDSLLTNNLVIDIKEDKKGVIWVSTMAGLNGIDTRNGKITHLTEAEGLKSNLTGPLAVDAHNRLWIGTSRGMSLLDSSRRRFTHFGDENGMPVVEMPEHAAVYTRNGDIIMPTIKGFVRFNPLLYQEKQRSIPFYLAAFRVFGSDTSVLHLSDHAGDIQLKADQNFFSIDMVAINFQNPSQTWFAYKLEGFDKDWRYTQDPRAVYTNVPGGTYRFLYKASAGAGNWPADAKSITVQVATVFYKAWWFWLALGAAAAATLYGWYRSKTDRQQQMMLLEGKAQALEKEKALVMYENLKQQLNPHFLFNSLTSLSGLIETDQRLAGNFLEQMSKIYRYILKSRDSELVNLKEELAFMDTYVKLQQTRFRQGLHVRVQVQEQDMLKKIPPVTLQNLLENAIKHNVIDADSPLVITISSDGEFLSVCNNLQKKNKVETSNKQGLASLQNLYHYLSDKPVEIEETADAFTIRLPLIS